MIFWLLDFAILVIFIVFMVTFSRYFPLYSMKESLLRAAGAAGITALAALFMAVGALLIMWPYCRS